MEWLNFRHLYAFWCVSRLGGFQKAAKKISVSQSVISEQVSQLEEYLEEKLLERTTRSVKLTERGSSLLTYADQIFAKSHEINHLFKDKQDTFTPTSIRIGMVGGISRNFVFRLLHQTLLQGETMTMNVVDGSLDELNALLKGFELDLIFSLERPRSKDLMFLDYRTVESSPLCLAATPDMIKMVKRRRAQPTPAELFMFNHPFEGDLAKDYIAPKFNLDCHVRVTTDDISLLRFLANAGRGLSVIPEIGIQDDLSAGRLSRIRMTDAPQVVFYASFLKNGFHRDIIEDFLS